MLSEVLLTITLNNLSSICRHFSFLGESYNMQPVKKKIICFLLTASFKDFSGKHRDICLPEECLSLTESL